MSFFRYLRIGNYLYYNALALIAVVVTLLVLYVLREDAIFWIVAITYASLFFASITGNYLRWLQYKRFNRAYKYYNHKNRYN